MKNKNNNDMPTNETKESKQLKLDLRYLRMARIWAENSYCQRRKVGALVVKEKMIISDGYNGTPSGFENVCEDAHGVTHPYVLHAEANAIISAARRDMIGGTLYLVGRSAADGELLHDTTSCAMCRRMIINSGITRVVNRIGDDGIEIIDVQNWIINDESIQPKAEAE